MAVDPTGKFAYVTNGEPDNNVSAYHIGAHGALKPVPGSPFAAGVTPASVAITPFVPFASSFAKLEIEKDRFDLKESFTLGANSNGINPVTENVTLQIGTFSVTIPAGSFNDSSFEGYVFDGLINGVSLRVQIVPLGNNIFTFDAVGTDVDLTGLTNPVTVVLTIGINSGTTTVFHPSSQRGHSSVCKKSYAKARNYLSGLFGRKRFLSARASAAGGSLLPLCPRRTRVRLRPLQRRAVQATGR